MRVFYEEEEPKRRYYVKIDNINVPEELKGYKAIEATTVEELINQVKEYYKFKLNPDFVVQLWSNNNHTGIRLDTLKSIPEGIEFIWVRGVLNKTDNK
jgi:L-lysine 2,3-aminomutase